MSLHDIGFDEGFRLYYESTRIDDELYITQMYVEHEETETRILETNIPVKNTDDNFDFLHCLFQDIVRAIDSIKDK